MRVKYFIDFLFHRHFKGELDACYFRFKEVKGDAQFPDIISEDPAARQDAFQPFEQI
jgi:hypothetical protein